MSDAAAPVVKPGGKRRLEFLDALRGLAAVYVVFYHMLLLPDPHLLPPRWVEKFAMAGGTGVTLFFIVSAFSLYYTMPMRLKERSPTRSFYLHRFFRIAPLFYFLILATLVRDRIIVHAHHSLAEIAASATFVFNLIPEQQQGFVWASWTIGVEMLFYAVFPLIYKRVQKTGDAVAMIAAFLFAWLVFQLMLDYSTMPEAWKASFLQWSVLKHMPVFASGVLLYHLLVSMPAEEVHAGHHSARGNALVWLGILGFASLLQGWLPDIFGNGYYWQAVMFGLLFMGLALSPWRVFVNAGTRFLGKISYSIYLNHPTVVLLLTPAYHAIYKHGDSLTLSFLACAALTFAVVLPLSYLTYRYIEEPGIEMGKRVANWFKARHEAKEAANAS
jgi:peptidoglycan/LPS O-acetylase OafA/YrhL